MLLLMQCSLLNPLFMVVLYFGVCSLWKRKEKAGYFLFVLLLLCDCSCYIVFVSSSRCRVMICGL